LCNFGVDPTFIVGAAQTFVFDHIAAVLFFGLLGASLAFGFCDLAEAVHARSVALGLGARACGEVREEVGAAGCEHARTKFL
jgi:hypothetical protein